MDILRMLRQAYRSRRQRKAWQRVVQVMAMIVVFCTTYALILPAITLERDAACGFTEHTHTEACYGTAPLHTHEEGCCKYNLICGLAEQKGHTHTDSCNGVVTTLICTADHVHEATCYSYGTGLTCGLEETAGHSHDASCYEKELICGLEEGAPEGELPLICELEEHTHTDACYPETEETTEPTEESSEPTEETTEPTEAPEETQTHDYVGQDLQAQVSLGADTAVPADADLTISAIEAGSEDYAAMETQLQSLVDQEILDLSLLDISFYDAAGEYLSVSDTATVTLTFNGMLYTDSIVTMYHFVDGTPVALEPPQINYTSLTAEDGTETTQTRLTFQTDGFSIFAVVEVVAAESDYDHVTDFDVNNMDGEYYIVNYRGTTAMMAHTTDVSTGRIPSAALSEATITDFTDFSTYTLWTVAKTGENAYTIHYTDDANITYYLQMTYYSGTLANLQLTTTADDASTFFFTAGTNDVAGKVSIGCTVNGKNYYINEHGGTDDYNGFTGWYEGTGGSFLQIYRKADAADTTVPATGLDGKSFAIVSNLVAKGLTTNTVTVNGVSGLASTNVTITTDDGVTYVEGDIPVWTFTATDTAGVYHIYTENATGDKQYLRLLDAHYQNNTSDGRGSLTLGTEPQAIRVSANDDGTVYLSYTDEKNVTGYINLDTAVYHFWTYSNTADADKLLLCSLTDIDESFTITYNNYTITVHFQDLAGNALLASVADISLTDGNSLTFADIAPSIDGYTYQKAVLENGNTDPVIASVTTNADGYTFRFYAPDYTEGSKNYYTKNQQNVELYLVYKSDQSMLYYDLNKIVSDGWVVDTYNDAPHLDADSQIFTEATSNLQTVNGKNAAGSFIAQTYSTRDTEITHINEYNADNGLTPADDGYRPPGAEWVFLGWQAENLDGETCLFPENAEAYMDEMGNICITDVNGDLQTVESGTELVGQWKLVSNVIYFFVNHADTMLEGENNNPIGSYSNEYYTEIAAIGHVYNIDDPNYFVDDGTIRIETHDELESLFQPNYDPALNTPQIVIDGVKVYENGTATYVEAENYNETLLEAAIAAYIRSQEGKTILLDNAELDKNMINADNYKLYWYGLKLVDSDANTYHMDGVLVAKTQTMEIYKTFSGLALDQTDALISTMTFPLHLIHSETDTAGNEVEVKDYYTTLKASQSQEGVYSYDGRQGANSNIFKWSMEAVLGQRYAFEEEGYALDGYTVSSLVSVHYKDGSIEYRYNTDATYKDEDTTTGTIDGLFKEKPLIGGSVESIIFANFYTPEDTGMFNISKVVDKEGQVRLSGAEFTLTDENGNIVATDVTNANGSAEFSALYPGTYTLRESKAPAGYQSIATAWTVQVTNTDGVVRVTIAKGTETPVELYNSSTGGLQNVYLIQNEPIQTTVTVNKYFTTITEAEVAQLKDSYNIQLIRDGTVLNTLTLNDATPITGTMNGYTWTLTGVNPGSYTMVENNYLHNNYLDTVVSATVSGTEVPVNKGDNTTSFAFTKSEAADTVNITNDYTNTFKLKIHKVDATNDNAGLPDVVFKIFGDFQQSTGSETLTYTDDKGVQHTVYFVASVTTDANGNAEYDGMKLSSGSRSFLYVVDEVETPAGYVKLSEPIVRVIDIDSEHYENGVYTMEIENFEIEKVTAAVNITAEKVWNVPADMTDLPAVTFTLYQKDGDGKVTSLGAVTLDAGNGWKHTWTGLPYATTATRHEYYIAEAELPGFATTYTTYLEKLTLENGTVVYAARVKDSESSQLNRHMIVTNSSSYELPESGGIGIGWHTCLGLSLILACVWLYWRGIYKKKRGGADSS